MRPEHVIPAIRSAPQTARTLTPDEIRHLRSLPYVEYLQTPWWRWRRNRALGLADYRCRQCSTKRDLEVHHTSYDRLGAERDEDLEVVCRGCHLGHHVDEAQEWIGIYKRVISAAITESTTGDLADILEAAKRRCAAAEIPVHAERFHAAAARLIPRMPFQPAAHRAELYAESQPHQPLTRAEAAGALAHYGLAWLMKHVPEVKPLTLRQAERQKAAKIYAQGILEQIQRCEEAERAAADAEGQS